MLRSSLRRGLPYLQVCLLTACGAAPPREAGPASGWPAYGGDPGGSRYSPLAQIHRGNVATLAPAWTYRTGDATHDDGAEGPQEGCGRCHSEPSKFETTPILAGGRLYLSTPLNRVIALDPESGRELWRHDPHIDVEQERAEGFISRGVAYWDGGAGGTCASRIFFGTVDARLIALDAARGGACRDFGDSGTVRLDRGVGEVQAGQYGMTSPPVVIGDVVVVGSSIGDNRRVELERGIVRGFEARSGRQRWSFDPVPRDPADPQYRNWDSTAARITGGGNAWAPLSVDADLGLVFVPTGSAAPDFFGGLRPGDNRYANSVVALEAETGKVRWHFQVVHHDLWDYDVASQPTLVTVPRDGAQVPAVAVATKMGHLFLLDRRTGTPLFPVEERPVPASDLPGERAAATQPFPLRPAPLHPSGLVRDSVWGMDDGERDACLALFDQMRSGPIFTPPTLQGTIMYPGFAGGMNWGGVAWDRERDLIITNYMRLPMWVRLRRRAPGEEPDNHEGTPYEMTRAMMASPRGLPCSAPPWGMIAAVSLRTGDLVWQRPHGRIPSLTDAPASAQWGSPNLGGPIVTAGGVVFIAAGMESELHALDVETGRELWHATLPAGGNATPMTYEVNGRQYVVIAAGGHGRLGSAFGDYVVAYAVGR